MKSGSVGRDLCLSHAGALLPWRGCEQLLYAAQPRSKLLGAEGKKGRATLLGNAEADRASTRQLDFSQNTPINICNTV